MQLNHLGRVDCESFFRACDASGHRQLAKANSLARAILPMEGGVLHKSHSFDVRMVFCQCPSCSDMLGHILAQLASLVERVLLSIGIDCAESVLMKKTAATAEVKVLQRLQPM